MAVRQDEPPQTAIAAGIYPTLNRIAEMEGESSAFASRLPDAPNRISWCATGLFFFCPASVAPTGFLNLVSIDYDLFCFCLAATMNSYSRDFTPLNISKVLA